MSALAKQRLWNRSDEAALGGSDVYAPRRTNDARIDWRTDYRDSAPNRPELAPQPLRSFSPLAVKTLLSEAQLGAHGLRLLDEQAQTWLVNCDADTLADERSPAGWHPALAERVDELRAAALDEEQIFSEQSAREALDFARELNASRRPGAFLVGNGNIRLLWNDGPEQIGLQFMGGGTVQFVMFARRGERVATVMGDDDMQMILRQITAAGLRHLLNA